MFKGLYVVRLTVTFWPGHCLGQGKVTIGNSLVWIVSILMRVQNIIKMSHMLDLRRLSYFIIFASALPWSMKNDISQAYWLDLVGIYQYAKINKISQQVKRYDRFH